MKSSLIFLFSVFLLLLTVGQGVWAADTPSQRMITSVDWYPFSDAMAIETGDWKRLGDYPFEGYVGYDDSEGGSDVLKIEWDLSGVDADTPGLYQAKGTLVLPENAVFSPEITLPEIVVPVSVQSPGKPEINCFMIGRGAFVFPWVGFTCNLEQVSVWISENNEKWRQLSEDEIKYLDNHQLILESKLFKKDKPYALQVRYKDGETEILSFVYQEDNMIYNYNDGNRDGDDAVEPDKSDIPGAPGILPESPGGIMTINTSEMIVDTQNSEPVKNIQSNDDQWKNTEDKITGDNTRFFSTELLHQLMNDYPEEVPFSFQNMLLLLPSEWIRSLNLPSDSLITITLDWLDNNTFRLLVKVGEQPVTELPGAKMRLFLEDAKNVQEISINGEQIPYSVEDNTVDFSLSQTGIGSIVRFVPATDTIAVDVDNWEMSKELWVLAAFFLLFLIYLGLRIKGKHEKNI